ncbi:hypothetical protein BJ322DRAFT_1094646, partial [Thelephora terrestris]
MPLFLLGLVLSLPLCHAGIHYLLCNPSHASKALCPLSSHASYLFASLTYSSHTPYLPLFCIDKGIDVMATPL